MTENQEVASQGGNRMTTSTSNPLGWKVGQKVKQSDCDSWGPVVRAALAAADAKRAELEGQA